jgi:hypothetical protein
MVSSWTCREQLDCYLDGGITFTCEFNLRKMNHHWKAIDPYNVITKKIVLKVKYTKFEVFLLDWFNIGVSRS